VSGKNFIIRENNISDSGMYGILTTGGFIDILYNRIANSGSGGVFEGCILLQDSDKNTMIEGNRIEGGNPWGMYVIRCPECRVRNNSFINNTKANAFVLDTAFAHWKGNYFDDWIGIGPKIVKGWLTKYSLPWANVDWHPSKEPTIVL